VRRLPVLPVLAVAAAWSTVGVVLSGLTRTGYTLVLTNTAGPALTGVVGAQISLAVLATMLWPAATGSAASKFVARAQGAGDEPLAAGVAAHLGRRTLATGAATAVLAGTAAVVVLDERPATALAVLPLVLGYSAYLLTRGVLLGQGRVARATRAELVALVVSLGGLAVLLARGATPLVLLPLAAGYLAYAALGWSRRAGRREVGPALRREMDAFVAWGVLGNVASAGLLQLCSVVAGATRPHVEVGLLTAAVALATPASLVARSLVQVLFPTMARSVGAGDHEAVARQTDVVTRGVVTVFVPAFAVLVLAARPLLRLAGPGQEFGGGTTALRILLVAVLLTTLPVAAVAAMTSGTAAGIRRSALMSATGLGVGVLGLAAFTGPFGIEGIAVAYLLGALVTVALPWAWTWRAQGQRWRGLTVRVALGIAGILAALAVQAALPAGTWWGTAVPAVVLVGAWAAASARDVRALLGRRLQ
jgi:O-antigen/teichoic acid export membrane protein